MKRPRPTKELLIHMSGGGLEGLNLLRSAHHGLAEVPLKSFYEHLDLDEVIAFASNSWQARKRRTPDPEFLRKLSIYDIFQRVFDFDPRWLKKHKTMPEELWKKYGKLNPYGGDDLKSRLENADPADVERLREGLAKDVKRYVFECDYDDAQIVLAFRRRDYEVVPMKFLPPFPQKGKILPGYAAQIARMISRYG